MPSAKKLAKKKAKDIAKIKKARERMLQGSLPGGGKKAAMKCRKERNKNNKRGNRQK